jgi:hypothetical protein
VWDFVVKLCCRNDSTGFFAVSTEGILLQVHLTELPPLVTVDFGVLVSWLLATLSFGCFAAD